MPMGAVAGMAVRVVAVGMGVTWRVREGLVAGRLRGSPGLGGGKGVSAYREISGGEGGGAVDQGRLTQGAEDRGGGAGGLEGIGEGDGAGGVWIEVWGGDVGGEGDGGGVGLGDGEWGPG